MRKSLLRRIRFFFFQLWRLVSWELLGVQGRNLPHFKGLIDANWKSSSSRMWWQYYYLPRPLEKGHFTPKMAKGVIFIFLNCICWYYKLMSTKVLPQQDKSLYMWVAHFLIWFKLPATALWADFNLNPLIITQFVHLKSEFWALQKLYSPQCERSAITSQLLNCHILSV